RGSGRSQRPLIGDVLAHVGYEVGPGCGGELKLGGGGSLGVAYKHPSGNPGCLHTFRPAAPAVRRGEPVEVGAFLHQVSLQSRSMSSVEDSKSSAWALRYSNANL